MEEKVLIVDDSLVARLSIKGALKECGVSFFEASSGEAALDLLSGGLVPSVVFLDLTMPGMGGLEALKAMRQKAPSLKVVVVTADVQARTLAELKAEGAFEVLRKPADRALVLSSFERATHPGAGK